MKTSVLVSALVACALSAPIASAQEKPALAKPTQPQASPSAPPSTSMPHGHMQHGATGSDGMKQSMMTGMDSMQKMPMSGDTDKDFAMMMKIHHQQALDMAKMQLEHGKSPIMKEMARKIISAQEKEIAQFDQWLATQK